MNTCRLFSFSVLIGLLAAGCHESAEPKPFTYSQVFTGERSKTWAITLFEETLDGKVVDRFTVDCTTDDEFTFHATSDRLYEAKSGSKKCSTDEPAITTDSWSFTNATATLTFILPLFSDSPLPFIVQEIDDDEMTLEIFFDEAGTASYKIYFELTDED